MTDNKVSDINERRMALDAGSSFVVQAPAGSGKTELLMQRYLALLSTVERPEEILALTFTRKAAGEMHGRIIGALRKAHNGAAAKEAYEETTLGLARAALARDKETGWALLENPGRLKVQTIDALCSSIVRQMPLVSRLPGHGAVTDEPGELYTEAARRTVLMIEDETPEGECVRKALRHLDNSVPALIDRIVIMLEKRDQWLRHINTGMEREELKALLEGSLERLIERDLEGLVRVFPQVIVAEILTAARFAAENVDEESPIKALSEIKGLPGASVEDLPGWRGLTELMLTKEGEWRKPNGLTTKVGFPPVKGDIKAMKAKKSFQETLAALSQEEDLRIALAPVRGLPDPRFTEDEWEILEELMRLLPVSGHHLSDVFAETRTTDFQAVSLAAIRALGTEDEPTDLMLSLDLRLRHILVDEYQDTSRTQLALIEALTRGWTGGDGRTIFVVGDPMQSIYLFREAQVGLFLEARQKGIGAIQLKPLRLTSNFRSHPEVIDWVNGSFAGAFPDAEDEFLGSVGYCPSVPVKKQLTGAGVDVTLYPERDDLAEARRIVSIIKETGTESTAILCRSRGHLEEVVKALEEEGIGFRAKDIDTLESRPVIKDLISLLRALWHPYDRVAWLAVLRAPWCGLELSDLFTLCAGDRDTPIWKLVNDEKRVGMLSGPGRQRLARLIEAFDGALEMKGRMPPRELLEGLWLRLGGPACVTDAGALNDAGAFLDLLSDVSGAASFGTIEQLEKRASRLFADHGSAETGLELMTIHKAKGLEFDNVIIPGLGKLPARQDRKLLLWMERGQDLILAPVEKKHGEKRPIYEYLTSIQSKKDAFEKVRLLYVAATRAKKRLFLTGHVKVADDGWMEAAGGSLLSIIGPVLTDGMLAPASADTEKKTEAPGLGPELKLKRLSSGWKAPVPARPVTTGPVKEELDLLERPEFHWAGERIKHAGTVVHGILCDIAKKPSQWDEARVASSRAKIEATLKGCGLSKADSKEAGGRVIEALCNALKDPRGRWILKGHPDGAVELPLTGVLDGSVVNAVIDRTFVDEKGVRWVIDYKTGAHEGGSREEFLEREKTRYRAQLERYAGLLKAGGEAREIRRGLYFPGLPGWIEWGD